MGMETMRRLISNFTVAFSGKNQPGFGQLLQPAEPLPAVQSDKLRCRLAPAGRHAVKAAMGLAATPCGDMVIADTGNHRVVIVTPVGDVRLTFGEPGDHDWCLNAPFGVAVTSDGSLAVTDTVQCSVKLFDSTGAFLKVLERPCGMLQSPRGLAVTQNDYFIVADSSQHCIFVLWSSGACRNRFGQLGSGAGDLNGPENVAVTLDRRILVTDRGNDSVKVFTFGGAPLQAYSYRDFRLLGSCDLLMQPAPPQLPQQHQQHHQLLGVACDHDDNILVTLHDTVGLVLPSGRIWTIIDAQDGLQAPNCIVYVPRSQCVAVLEPNHGHGRGYVLLYNHEPESFRPYRCFDDAAMAAASQHRLSNHNNHSQQHQQQQRDHQGNGNLVRTAAACGRSVDSLCGGRGGSGSSSCERRQQAPKQQQTQRRDLLGVDDAGSSRGNGSSGSSRY